MQTKYYKGEATMVNTFLLGSFEAAVLADMRSLSALLSHMLVHLVLGDGL